MNKSERNSWNRLKSLLATHLRNQFPEVSEDITNWKSKEIGKFQEDLLQKVNGRISEKWFYTHIKTDHKALPRIDILDLLSQYVGYQDWNQFLSNDTRTAKGLKWYHLLPVPMIVALIVGVYYSVKGSHQFCFVDTYSRELIESSKLEVYQLKEGESPKRIEADSSGCFLFKTASSSVELVVKSAYYHTDTISRHFDERRTYEIIGLRTDDYTTLIHLLSNDNIQEWSERKKDLEMMFTDNAKIYQLMDHGNYALAIYNKQEFIRKLMLPSGNLKRLEVLEKKYERGQISVLRFKIGKK